MKLLGTIALKKVVIWKWLQSRSFPHGQARVNALLESQDHSGAEVETRFRIVPAARRKVLTNILR